VHGLGLLVIWGVSKLERARSREDGQAMVEYALLLFLIAIVSFVILTVLGTKVSVIFNEVVHDI
jgi:Flp pilus assembly pilin Flp